MPDPEPGHAAERHFQTAGPVYADRVGVLLLPVVPLVEQLAGILFLAADAVGLGQGNEMLVPIQLPDSLRVTHLRKIEIANAEPGFTRDPLVVDNVQLPV